MGAAGRGCYQLRMPTILTHPLVPAALAASCGRRAVPPRLLTAACLASILPDADVLAFRFGIPYASEFGHRGFTHSIAFALAVGMIGALLWRALDTTRLRVFSVLALATLSHALLDALTNGGLGVALFWPLDDARFFFPLHPIEVSPIGISGFLSPRGLEVLASEAKWIGLPLLALSLTALALRRLVRRGRAGLGGSQSAADL